MFIGSGADLREYKSSDQDLQFSTPPVKHAYIWKHELDNNKNWEEYSINLSSMIRVKRINDKKM